MKNLNLILPQEKLVGKRPCFSSERQWNWTHQTQMHKAIFNGSRMLIRQSHNLMFCIVYLGIYGRENEIKEAGKDAVERTIEL